MTAFSFFTSPQSNAGGFLFAKKLTLPKATYDKFQLKVTLTFGK
jgi:hypothetical protein